MNQDSAFFIGSNHSVCQDYARSGEIEGINFAIISDGCSSSCDTDFGSRLLVMESIRIIKTFFSKNLEFNPHELGLYLSRMSLVLSNINYLNNTAMDATLFMVLSNDTTALILGYGDGIAFARKKDGSTDFRKISFPSGYPAYLNYHSDGKRKSAYKMKSKKVVIDSGNMLLTDYIIWESSEEKDPLTPFVWYLNKNVYDFIGVMSDGVETFYRIVPTEYGTVQEIASLNYILSQILSVKRFAGSFLQRRMNKFIKTIRKDGWVNFDDLSVAAIHLGE